MDLLSLGVDLLPRRVDLLSLEWICFCGGWNYHFRGGFASVECGFIILEVDLSSLGVDLLLWRVDLSF